MNENTVTGDFININLRQLGATSIKEYNSIMHIAEFDLGDGLIVSYVFNITRHNKYFLQRVQPYAMIHGKFASDREILEFIQSDLKRFVNAKNSKNFDTFLLISHLGHHVTENIEKLFLNYNVDPNKLEGIQEKMEESLTDIINLYQASEKIDLKGASFLFKFYFQPDRLMVCITEIMIHDFHLFHLHIRRDDKAIDHINL